MQLVFIKMHHCRRSKINIQRICNVLKIFCISVLDIHFFVYYLWAILSVKLNLLGHIFILFVYGYEIISMKLRILSIYWKLIKMRITRKFNMLNLQINTYYTNVLLCMLTAKARTHLLFLKVKLCIGIFILLFSFLGLQHSFTHSRMVLETKKFNIIYCCLLG